MSNDEENVLRGVTDHLTTEQLQNVSHLQEIVGSITEDVAVNVLQDCDWNLENAVNKLLGLYDSTQEHSGVHLRRFGNVDSYPAVNLTPPNQSVLRVVDTDRQGWWWMLWMLVEPIRFTLQIISGVARFLASFIWPDSRNRVTDPVGDVQRFIEYFRDTYANGSNEPGTDGPGEVVSSVRPILQFYGGSYAQALQDAKQSLRFLIVYLHGDSHEDTNEFCIQTLQNENVIRYLNNTDEFIVWGCNIKSPEGYRVSRTLREHAYPFIGVIGLTNLSVSDNGPYVGNTVGMALLGRIEGAVKPNDLIRQLNVILEDHQGATLAARLDRREREATARIREEQDIAYQQSLAQDRAKLVVREQELRSAQQEAEERAKLARVQEAMKRAKAARRAGWKERLPPAPSSLDSSTVQLSVKLPNGRRLSRVFSIKDSIKILYYFVLSHDDAPENFEIQANFPKRLLPCQPKEESDIEEYMLDSDKDSISENNIAPSHVLIDSPETRLRKPKSIDIVYDWTPQSPTDPPTFEELGLTTPEVLFVIDTEA